jgi:preprotein translocase subunit SecE
MILLHSSEKSLYKKKAIFFNFFPRKMLDFIYDSLETVKHLKHPDKKLYLTLTIAIFAIVIVAGLYFVLADAIFGEGYQLFYQAMTGQL